VPVLLVCCRCALSALSALSGVQIAVWEGEHKRFTQMRERATHNINVATQQLSAPTTEVGMRFAMDTANRLMRICTFAVDWARVTGALTALLDSVGTALDTARTAIRDGRSDAARQELRRVLQPFADLLTAQPTAAGAAWDSAKAKAKSVDVDITPPAASSAATAETK
jgi:hypothetical protein